MPSIQTVAATAAALVLVAASSASAQQCPTAAIPAVSQQITQVFNGGSEDYMWTISLSNPVDQAPTGYASCGSSAYVSQYSESDKSCSSNIQFAGAAAPTSTGCKYNFHDAIRIADIDVSCGTSETLTLDSTVSVTANADNTYTYSFKGTYAGVCTGPAPGPSPDNGGGGGSSGCGGGCVFVIVFFVGAFLYVAGTVAFNFFKNGRRGKELAPHPEFWLMIPGLIKDGVLFTGNLITSPCRKSDGGSTYTQV